MNYRTAASMTVIAALLLVPSLAMATSLPAPANPLKGFTGNRPADKAVVPRNVKLWLRVSTNLNENPPTVTLTDASAPSIELPLTAAACGTQLQVYTPTTMLLSNATYQVRFNKEVQSTFTTDDSIDTTPPAPPVLESASTGYSVTPAGEVSMLVESSSAKAELPSVPMAVSTGALFPGPIYTTNEIAVITFDLAGNASVSPSIKPPVRMEQFPGVGCSSASDLALPGIAALVIALSLRRRSMRAA